jgi:hypothetical protein
MRKIILSGLLSSIIVFNSWAQEFSSPDMAARSSSKKAIVLEEFVFMDGPTRDCHASSLLELANGDLLVT